jgi:hypothetical protein
VRGRVPKRPSLLRERCPVLANGQPRCDPSTQLLSSLVTPQCDHESVGVVAAIGAGKVAERQGQLLFGGDAGVQHSLEVRLQCDLVRVAFAENVCELMSVVMRHRHLPNSTVQKFGGFARCLACRHRGSLALRRRLEPSPGADAGLGRGLERSFAARDHLAVADLASTVADARASLGGPGPLAGADGRVPNRPGLYAIYGDAKTWQELGLGEPPDGRPLYIGKAEDSLVTRDLKTHFGDGRTGQSTLRRSFAALLHDPLALRGIPRNTAKPGYFSNYGLSAAHDAALTRWMRERLELAAWPKPTACALALGQIEGALVLELQPPLNLQGVVTPWTAQVKAARSVMAEEAKAWKVGQR